MTAVLQLAVLGTVTGRLRPLGALVHRSSGACWEPCRSTMKPRLPCCSVEVPTPRKPDARSAVTRRHRRKQGSAVARIVCKFDAVILVDHPTEMS